MVEPVQQRTDAAGGLRRRQSAVGGGNGEHFGFAVAEKHDEGPQVVGRAVGVDDYVEPRFARVGEPVRDGGGEQQGCEQRFRCKEGCG